jgi:hypothetical protein
MCFHKFSKISKKWTNFQFKNFKNKAKSFQSQENKFLKNIRNWIFSLNQKFSVVVF